MRHMCSGGGVLLCARAQSSSFIVGRQEEVAEMDRSVSSNIGLILINMEYVSKG